MKKTLYNKNDIKIDLVSDLMENHFVESTIDASKGLKSLSFKNTQSVCFFIDKTSKLYSVYNDAESNSGWKAVQVSIDGEEVTAFDVYQDKLAATFRLSYAFKNEKKESFLAYTPVLTLKSILEELTVLRKNATLLPIVTEHKKVNILHVSQVGIAFGTSYGKEDAVFYSVRFESSKGVQKVELPEHGESIIQIQLGKLGAKSGFYMLYNIGKEQTMLFRELKKEGDEGLEFTQRFKTDHKINYFALIQNETGGSELFTSGDGIYRFKNRNEKEEIVPSGGELIFGKISVELVGEKVFVWVTGKQQNKSGLYYFTNAFHQKNGSYSVRGQWTKPLLMHENVNHFDNCSDKEIINKLFLSTSENDNSTDSELSLFWQDPKTSFWDEQSVNVDDLNNVIEKETYTISLFMSSEQTEEVSFTLTSDESTYLYLDGKKHFLTPKRGLELDFEKDKRIQLIIPIEEFDVPDFTLSSTEISESIHFSVSGDTLARLEESFETPEKIKSLKKQNGESLISETTSTSDLVTVSEFMKNVKELQAEKPNLKSALAAPKSATDDLEMGLGSFFSDVYSSIGDVLHSIKEGLIEAASFVVEKVNDGIKFIVKIAGQVFDFIVEKVKAVLKAIGEILKKIGTFFKDLFDLLGFLFNWKDIIITKNVLKEFGLEKLREGKNQITYLKELVKNELNTVRLNLEKQQDQINKKYSKELRFADISGNKQPDSDESKDNKLNWVSSKKEVMFGKSDVRNSASKEDVSTMKAAAEKHSIPSEILELFINVFSGKIGFTEFIEKLMNALARLALEILDYVVDKIFDWLFEVYDVIFKFLSKEIEIPLLSYLYRKISDSELSIIDMVSLLIAIPVTVGYKIEFKKAPFEAGDKLNLNF